jgi:hypothetical protein
MVGEEQGRTFREMETDQNSTRRRVRLGAALTLLLLTLSTVPSSHALSGELTIDSGSLNDSVRTEATDLAARLFSPVDVESEPIEGELTAETDALTVNWTRYEQRHVGQSPSDDDSLL